MLKTSGEIAAAVCGGMSRFEQEYPSLGTLTAVKLTVTGDSYSAAGSPPTFDFISTVTYTFTPAVLPEPASLGLLGLGALGLLAKRRRA